MKSKVGIGFSDKEALRENALSESLWRSSMHHEEQHLSPALQIISYLASTTLQHTSLELNGLWLNARIQIVITSQVEMQILFTPKAPSKKKKTTTQHTKDSSFFTCHLITGDISRAGTADLSPATQLPLPEIRSGCGQFVPGKQAGRCGRSRHAQCSLGLSAI